MSYPILAPNSTWFAPTNNAVTRSILTEIEIMDSYSPDASVVVVDSWDASEAKNGSITCYVIGTKLIIAGNGSGKIAANEDSYQLFTYCETDWSAYDLPFEVEQILGLNILDTSKVRTFSYMFYYCEKIKNLDLSTFDTASATDLSYMFGNCSELSSLNISNWDTSKVTTTQAMFASCNSLEYVEGLDNFNSSNVTNFSRMFSYTKVSNFTNLDTSKVTNLSYTFMNYLRETLIFPNWDISNVENYECCFAGGSKGGTIKTLDLSNFKHKPGVPMHTYMFATLESLNTIILPPDFGKGVQNFSRMFYGLKNMAHINLENIDFSHATNLHGLFTECSKLTDLDVSNWDVSNITDMSFMFYGCTGLKEIDVSNWNVSKVTNFDHFAAHANLKRKGIENWNTASAINMNALFHNCAEEELDLSGWNVSKVQFFCQMFENSPNLKRIKGLENWDTSSGLGFDEMFERCYKLEEVNLSAFNTIKAKNGVSASTNGHTTNTIYNMFKDCRSLKKVTLGLNFSINGDGTNTTAANKLILPTPSADYIDGADGSWYTFTGQNYTSNAIPDRTYNTYYASKNLIRDLVIRINNGTILDIVKAVREKVPNLEPTLLSDLDDIIRNI